jgi:hypothetical protein
VAAENNPDPGAPEGAPDTHEARSDRLSRALELIGAVAHRDAYPEDIVAQLRNEGFDALDVVVAALAGQARKQPAARRRAQRPIDVRSFWTPTPPELAAQIVHKVPKVPFVLNGTLYDPEDVRRFDGRELHFLVKGDELVAFEDRDVMARAWELMFVAPRTETPLIAPANQLARGGPEGPAPWPWWPWDSDDDAGTYFYEDSGYEGWGAELYLRQNYGYWDLTEVCRGFLCSDDWNDVISAVGCFFKGGSGPTICVLHEHINMQGSTLTCCGCKELDSFGWNDRASSVETW